LASADKSSHQHCVRFLGPNHLLMFDNGNASQLTKIREYQIDPVEQEVVRAELSEQVLLVPRFEVPIGSVGSKLS
jgi:hypothetical protein